MMNNAYTNIGTSLVFINPHKPITIPKSLLREYRLNYWETAETGKILPPHVFQMANNVYHHMKHTSKDQCIVISGESGSGKSENHRLIVDGLVQLSAASPGKIGRKIILRFRASETVLEAFGHARTLFNASSSRFGKYTELQFGGDGRLCGAKILNYHLECNRRNFHIFYYLVAGASPDERRSLHIKENYTYRYLGQQGPHDLHDDSLRFEGLKSSMKTAGIGKRYITQIFQLLSAILLLGNLEFSFDRSQGGKAAVVRNMDVLEVIAGFLGVATPHLEDALSQKIQRIGTDVCAILLDPDSASDNRDDFAATLYSLLFAWLNNHMNQRLYKDDFTTFISLLDFPGPQNLIGRPNSFDQFCFNFANERLVRWTQTQFFERHLDEYVSEGIIDRIPRPRYSDNREIIHLFEDSRGGFISIMNGQAERMPMTTDHTLSLLRPDVGLGSTNPFIRELFDVSDSLTTTYNKSENISADASFSQKTTLVLGQDKSDPKPPDDTTTQAYILDRLKLSMDTLFGTLGETQAWFVFCINPNNSYLPSQFDGRSVTNQVRSLGLGAIAEANTGVLNISISPQEFVERYGTIFGLDTNSVFQKAVADFHWGEREALAGNHKFFLCHDAFRQIENMRQSRLGRGPAVGDLSVLDTHPPAIDAYVSEDSITPYSPTHTKRRLLEPNDAPETGSVWNEGSPYHIPTKDGSNDYWDHSGASTPYPEPFTPSRTDLELIKSDASALAGEIEGETSILLQESSTRRRWVLLCWILTFWVPTPCLGWVGRMKRPDVQQAWREKLALNMMIWLICGAALFVIVFLGRLICPIQHVFTPEELASHSLAVSPNNVYTSIRGEVFDLTSIAENHHRIISVVPTEAILQYGGLSADDIFPIQISAVCNGVTGSVSPYVSLDPKNITDDNAVYHDFRASTTDPRPDWYFENMVQMRYTGRLGFMGYTPKTIRNMAATGRSVGVYKNSIYDLTPYLESPPTLVSPPGTVPPPNIDINFMDSRVVDVFRLSGGGDVTKQLDNLPIDSAVLARQKICLRNIFLVGQVDNRQSAQCLFAANILLALSILMVSVIGFKFIASINFARTRSPENHDKFLICQIPCYTEGEESLRRTFESLAQTKYDDKRKLLVVICDGMPLSFLSLGEGGKQHNMAKVYSGLYECAGHVVPYLVVVKTGKPNERSRPGNRGKRDSQMLLMRFLNNVHFNSPMNPLELEMYHQIKNVIGVNPTFYEYLFTVDADTTVDPFSINRLVSAMVYDKKLLGVCGDTQLANAKQSFITMMQVYEYFISHHMAKSFESLFGSVTCLPGCFTLYRLRTPDAHKPLLISNQVIRDYSENRVDTLHVKNLLHLGEDRYLTTLLLKHFPRFKTQFIHDAHAYTVAPDDWRVLLSQRRRWINSTVHNLGELVFLQQLCGFCCFSMRFVVMIDLVSTLTQPVTVGYLAYLIYLTAGLGQVLPITSIVLIAAIYGLQALVFILRRRWDMSAWLLCYILAIPVFSFILPLYSFWKMDDFSWGATRLVLGEAGKKMIDEGQFDPQSIPLKSWNEYEQELWETQSDYIVGQWSPAPQDLFTNQPSDGRRGYHPELNITPKSGNILRPPSSLRFISHTPTSSGHQHSISEILSMADLNSITKREIRLQLEDRFGWALIRYGM
ncbi:chitin synthase-domain-containing protein [Infundibulicybe gibba]|nr:chitin synthase-domain-containing protein [Infundibulicybe gibba]